MRVRTYDSESSHQRTKIAKLRFVATDLLDEFSRQVDCNETNEFCRSLTALLVYFRNVGIFNKRANEKRCVKPHWKARSQYVLRRRKESSV